MADVDLVPSDYRRTLQLRGWLRCFGVVLLGVVVSLGVARLGLAQGIRAGAREVEELRAAEENLREQQARLAELTRQRRQAHQRLTILSGLRGGVAAREMFRVVDRALDGTVWFLDWNFRRAGELVDNDPEKVDTGYFVVVPLEKRDAAEKAWLVQTHMEIRGQAEDHSTLADFVRRLLEEPRIANVRVLNTRVHRYTDDEVVDFELAVVVRTEG